MEAIGQLAGGVAHDFNNLLTAIIGYSELVRDGLGADHHLAHDVEEILKAGSRAEALTRQLLAFSRKQILRPELLDLNEVVREFSTMLGRLIGEDVRMEMALSPGLSSVRADRGQIEQVIMNLAVNARDAMPHGGTLAIETHDVELDEDYLDEHPRAAAGHYVCLALSDTGLGMPPAVRARIFEPFFSTKGSKGTGLGLSTAYGIVEQSGGRILVYSEPGLGTTFKVYLPANGLRPESRSVPPVESAAGLSGTETVLVVEDDDTVRDLSVRALAGCGYRVFDAAAAEQALTIARQPGTHIDALVTDLVMPGLDGHSLADLLSISRSNLRVLYSSGYSPAVALQHGVRVDKGRAFIQKPYSGVRLARAVRTLLDRPVAVP